MAEQPLADRREESTWRPPAGLWLLPVLLAAGLLWVNASPAKVSPDEHYYTDAAIQMCRTGDYWTPTYPDGQIRLVKPILTYWALVGSFRAFGINLLASRLPSALAGVLVVCLTYQLARTVTNSRRASLLAAAIIAANMKVLVTATRATPDVFVCLFTLVSMWGFARVLFQRDKSVLGPLLAFVGMGLAVQTKGLLGLWPLAALGLFRVIGNSGKGLPRELWRWAAIALGILLAVFWYAVMLHRHSAGALHDFFQDQVGAKVSRNPLFMLGTIAFYLLVGLQHFLPWTALLLVAGFGQRAALAGFWREHRRQMLFLLIPFGLLVVAFSFGNVRAQRYLTCSFPMLAVLLAMVLVNGPLDDRVLGWARRLCWPCAALTIAAGAGLAIAGLTPCGALAAGGLILLGVGIAGVFALRNADKLWCWIWIAGLVGATFVVKGAALGSLLSPQSLPPLAQTLRQQCPPDTRICAWQFRSSRAGLLRLLTGGTLVIVEPPAGGAVPDSSAAPIVVTTSPHQALFQQAGYEVTQIEPEASACASIEKLVQRLYPRKAKKKADPRDILWLATQSPAEPQ